MNEGILTLRGKVGEFLEYDSRPLSQAEKASLQRTIKYYKSHEITK